MLNFIRWFITRYMWGTHNRRVVTTLVVLVWPVLLVVFMGAGLLEPAAMLRFWIWYYGVLFASLILFGFVMLFRDVTLSYLRFRDAERQRVMDILKGD